MGGCQNYGPLLDPCKNTAPNIFVGTQKTDHNFDNHLHDVGTSNSDGAKDQGSCRICSIHRIFHLSKPEKSRNSRMID